MTFLRPLLLLLCLALPVQATPSQAETPWAAAETIRSEAGRIERLLYRSATEGRDADIASRLARMRRAWDAVADQFGQPAISAGLATHEAAARRGDAPAAAHARQILWAGLTTAARDRAFAAIDAGDAATAASWLTIRDYARASGDTAAALALQSLGRGELDPAEARASVEAELLSVAASELRLALGRAADDAAVDRMTQYAGDLGRIEGLTGYLSASLRAHLGAVGMASLLQALAQAQDDPSALAGIETLLAGYAPVSMSDEEKLRRARLLRRFTTMVWEEYKDGVRNGEISQPMEYTEARMFRDRAAMILGDLAPQLADPASAQELAGLMAQMKQRIDARSDGIEPLVAQALTLIDQTFGAEVAAGGYAAAVDALPAALDELAMKAVAGDWAGSEMKRMEAYSWFDPDIEQRLVPRAPAIALRMEARFWEGTVDRPGLGALIATAADPSALKAEIEGIKSDLAEARLRIETPSSMPGAVLQSAGIVFREGLEAVLILAALLAALRAEGVDPRRYHGPMAIGVGLALVASLVLWIAARWVFSISTLAREALEGATALLAAAVLVWLVMGLSAGGGHVAAMRRKLAGAISVGSVATLAFLVVFREGFETVLFYEAMLVDAATGPVLTGLVVGAGAALVAGWLVLASGKRLPVSLYFRATTVLLAILAVMLVGAGMRGLQTAALMGATPVGWFPDRDWLQLWFGLYPVAEPLVAQALTLAVMMTPGALRRVVSA